MRIDKVPLRFGSDDQFIRPGNVFVRRNAVSEGDGLHKHPRCLVTEVTEAERFLV